MAQGSFSVAGKTYTWRNNPSSGKLDIFDEDGEHIGQAPNADEAKKFIERESKKGNLSAKQMGAAMDGEKVDKRIEEKLAKRSKLAAGNESAKVVSLVNEAVQLLRQAKAKVDAADDLSQEGDLDSSVNSAWNTYHRMLASLQV